MTVTRRLAAILAADCDEISETGLLVDPEGTYRAFRRMSAHWGKADLHWKAAHWAAVDPKRN